mmetsp:Transcript_24290/g.63710  ORF Transcript_24290/g.63710 Transcript_24290/m.63710 type:complete len:233 (-) Transcript_24290:202-900(-)
MRRVWKLQRLFGTLNIPGKDAQSGPRLHGVADHLALCVPEVIRARGQLAPRHVEPPSTIDLVVNAHTVDVGDIIFKDVRDAAHGCPLLLFVETESTFSLPLHLVHDVFPCSPHAFCVLEGQLDEPPLLPDQVILHLQILLVNDLRANSLTLKALLQNVTHLSDALSALQLHEEVRSVQKRGPKRGAISLQKIQQQTREISALLIIVTRLHHVEEVSDASLPLLNNINVKLPL